MTFVSEMNGFAVVLNFVILGGLGEFVLQAGQHLLVLLQLLLGLGAAAIVFGFAGVF